ncbi:MAG TPA: transcriptional regulator [Leptospiraceae bacterium]|nr:transcriptional regulator [Spirochaetaceae bacterium]HBS04658.1 transcriptional regulator [Leptospiraceae bacterium]|tara:strand:+ start:36658 stop:36984 length:327 start_codon:yes stop_codon:yes gene_type:complete
MAAAPNVDLLFKALGDKTRRLVVENLSRGPATVSELAMPFDLALPSFMQHMKMLEEAGLVKSTKEGRVRIYRLNRAGFKPVQSWLSSQERMWEKRLNQLDSYLLEEME